MNILILSCGSRNKIVQYFKKELEGKGKVIATDSSELAPALYEADEFYIVPRIDENGYLESILEICKQNRVNGVISLIDPELSILADNREKFIEIGAIPIVSDYEDVELCFNKFEFNSFLGANGYSSIKSYINKENFYNDLDRKLINFPVFVKPIKGSASLNISKVNTSDEIELLFDRYDNLMIQEFIDGPEYGADVYIDILTGTVTSIFIKEKIKMRAGETDKSVSLKDEFLFTLIKNLVEKIGLRGIIDIDIFKQNGNYYISEINPRFGGGYPHAYECNVNVPKMIVDNLMGKRTTNTIGTYEDGVFMMKFNEVLVTRGVKR